MKKGRSFRSRFVDLSLEAVMVVFAVVLALNLESWREDRQLEVQADRIEASVIAEVRANLTEFEGTRDDLETGLRFLQGVIESRDASRVPGVALTLPQFSSAAWLASEASPAAANLDYRWRIEVSRAYENYDLYSQVGFALLESISPIIARPPSIEELDGIFGRLVVLVQLHNDLIDGLTSVLETTGDNEADSIAIE